jgi:hypothetical protein
MTALPAEMDMFEQFKAAVERGKKHGVVCTHAELWLIAEVERLRKIEDAALEWHRADPHETEDAVEALADAIDFNPRPEGE